MEPNGWVNTGYDVILLLLLENRSKSYKNDYSSFEIRICKILESILLRELLAYYKKDDLALFFTFWGNYETFGIFWHLDATESEVVLCEWLPNEKKVKKQIKEGSLPNGQNHPPADNRRELGPASTTRRNFWSETSFRWRKFIFRIPMIMMMTALSYLDSLSNLKWREWKDWTISSSDLFYKV